MTVYVDDMRMYARVGRISSHWSHLVADTRDELHEFAARLGLKRSWFQEPKGIGTISASARSAQNWHYDVTDSKRELAITLGATAVTTYELVKIIDTRYALEYPEAAATYRAALNKVWSSLEQ
jgi:hypothetical protein